MSEQPTDIHADRPEQRDIVAILGALEVTAPRSLHHSVEAMVSQHRARRVRPGRRALSLTGAAALAAAAVVVAVLAWPTGTRPAPTVLQASELALRSATAGSPAESPDGTHLTSSVDGVAYPYWGKRFGWRTAGARTDQLGGRSIMTVFYADARAQRIGYSIVAGPALTPPDSRIVNSGGVDFRVLERAGATIVTWRREGHTCVLAGRGVSEHTLVALAGWRRT